MVNYYDDEITGIEPGYAKFVDTDDECGMRAYILFYATSFDDSSSWLNVEAENGYIPSTAISVSVAKCENCDPNDDNLKAYAIVVDFNRYASGAAYKVETLSITGELYTNSPSYKRIVKDLYIETDLCYKNKFYYKTTDGNELDHSDFTNNIYTTASCSAETDCYYCKFDYPIEFCDKLAGSEIPNIMGETGETWNYWGSYSEYIEVSNGYICKDCYNEDFDVNSGCGFGNMEQIESLIIPASVSKLNPYAFTLEENLTKVIFEDTEENPSQLTEIAKGSFKCCHHLSTLTLPDTLTEICDEAFCHCDISALTIPNSVTKIGYRAFYEALDSKTLIINAKNGILIDTEAFNSVNLESLTFNISGDTTLGYFSFSESYLKSLIFNCSSGDIKIGGSCFQIDKSVTKLDLPSNISEIGNVGIAIYSNCDVWFDSNTKSAPTFGSQPFGYGKSITVTIHVPNIAVTSFTNALSSYNTYTVIGY